MLRASEGSLTKLFPTKYCILYTLQLWSWASPPPALATGTEVWRPGWSVQGCRAAVSLNGDRLLLLTVSLLSGCCGGGPGPPFREQLPRAELFLFLRVLLSE